ncbi:MAG: hypothetical protein OXH57_02175 [Ekhidna sp.]|nr:hypothetical protein [Ekhidna sp.]
MKKNNRRRNRQSLIKGVESSFNIMGDGLEQRDNDNLTVSWYNVGIYYKRALSNHAVRRGFNNRFSREELTTM